MGKSVRGGTFPDSSLAFAAIVLPRTSSNCDHAAQTYQIFGNAQGNGSIGAKEVVIAWFDPVSSEL
jgi:hypothetical protein